MPRQKEQQIVGEKMVNDVSNKTLPLPSPHSTKKKLLTNSLSKTLIEF